MKAVNSKCSVIVVLYYSGHLVEKLISEIYEKINAVDEILLIDNSNESLRRFENDFVKVHYPGRNLGYGGAINFGIKKARNELYLIVNPDITLQKFAIPKEISVSDRFILSGIPGEWDDMPAFPELVNDVMKFTLGDLSTAFKSVARNRKKVSINKNLDLQAVQWVSGSLIVTNKKTMDYLGGFDERYFLFYEEVDLCKRAEIKNVPVLIASGIEYQCNQGTSSSSDVSTIKSKACIQSAQLYHNTYSPASLTRAFFLGVKVFAWFVFRGLNVVGIFLRNKKISGKAKQYATYFNSII